MGEGGTVAVGVTIGSIAGVLVAVAMTVAVGVANGLLVASGSVQLTITSKNANQNIQRLLNIYLLPWPSPGSDVASTQIHFQSAPLRWEYSCHPWSVECDPGAGHLLAAKYGGYVNRLR